MMYTKDPMAAQYTGWFLKACRSAVENFHQSMGKL
jgi:hypothetical protein